MRPHTQKIGFSELAQSVIEPNICSGCAACTISCPHDGILGYMEEKPLLMGECRFCGICTKVCPRFDFDPDLIEEKFLGRKRFQSEEYGVVRKIFVARSTSNEILRSAQDGGVATALLSSALNDGLIDAAIVSGTDRSRPWVPRPMIASTYEEILACSGTRYSYSPNLLLLPGAIRAGFRSLAVVGTPCTISGFRKIQLLGLRRLTEPVKLLIGLMCSECFSFECMMERVIRSRLKIDPSLVTKINIKGRVLVELANGSRKLIQLEEVKSCARKSCRACDDLSSEYADISLGGLGLSASTLTIARSEGGEDLLLRSKRNGFLEFDEVVPQISLDLLKKLSRMKRKRAANFYKDDRSFHK
ncbi:MAG: Coenzyme F420 hydrogenase/dehydrogenase, beta subunit C-terminal domain [Thermoproteota archaeon]